MGRGSNNTCDDANSVVPLSPASRIYLNLTQFPNLFILHPPSIWASIVQSHSLSTPSIPFTVSSVILLHHALSARQTYRLLFNIVEI